MIENNAFHMLYLTIIIQNTPKIDKTMILILLHIMMMNP